jgi:hypothetical protein
MPSILYFSSSSRRGEQTTRLTIRKSFWSKRFSYKFTQMEFIVANPSDTLKINLVANRSISKYTIQIQEHCCTRPAAMKRLVGDNTVDPPAYEQGLLEATYRFSLCERELIQIGVIVRVFENGKYIGDLLCDPQVGNGPPSRNGFVPVELSML